MTLCFGFRETGSLRSASLYIRSLVFVTISIGFLLFICLFFFGCIVSFFFALPCLALPSQIMMTT